MDKKKCVVCGFNKGICSHHIIKRRDCGDDGKDNLVYLCPNHHWIADFGTDEEKNKILGIIKTTTGKIGKEISDEEKIILDKKIKVLEEEFLCGVPFPSGMNGVYNKPFSEEEWEKHKNSWNYDNLRKELLGRGGSVIQTQLLHKKAEILILINKLKEELKQMRF